MQQISARPLQCLSFGFQQNRRDDLITLISPRKLHFWTRSELITDIHQITYFLVTGWINKKYIKSCYTFWPVENYLCNFSVAHCSSSVHKAANYTQLTHLVKLMQQMDRPVRNVTSIRTCTKKLCYRPRTLVTSTQTKITLTIYALQRNEITFTHYKVHLHLAPSAIQRFHRRRNWKRFHSWSSPALSSSSLTVPALAADTPAFPTLPLLLWCSSWASCSCSSTETSSASTATLHFHKKKNQMQRLQWEIRRTG